MRLRYTTIGALLGIALGAVQARLLMFGCVLAVFLQPGYLAASALLYPLPSLQPKTILVLGIMLNGLFFALAGAVLAEGRVRRERSRNPLVCRKCEYSLIGNTSGICPECGARIPKN